VHSIKLEGHGFFLSHLPSLKLKSFISKATCVETEATNDKQITNRKKGDILLNFFDLIEIIGIFIVKI